MNEQQALTEFYKARPEFRVDANSVSLLDEAKTIGPISVITLSAAAARLISTLLLSPYFQAAWHDFIQANPTRNNLAARAEFFEKIRGKAIEAETAAENERRKSLSITELRELARKETPAPQRLPLPRFYTPFGKKEEIELTGQVLSDAGKRNADLSIYDFRFLVNRYGSDYVNARIGVQPTVQPGFIKSVKVF